MEGIKKSGSSPSSPSLTSQLFGSRDNPPSSSSSGIFGSIFAPPSKVRFFSSKGSIFIFIILIGRISVSNSINCRFL